MSEGDSTSRGRPPTIDLTAEEVKTPEPGSPAKADAEAASRTSDASPGGRARPSGRATPYAIGGVIGAVVIAAVGAGLWIAGLLPANQAAAPQAAITSATPVDINEISARLDKIQQALQAPHPDAALAYRLTTVEAQSKVLADSLAALAHRVDETAGAGQTALAQAKSAAATAEAAKGAVQASAQRSDLEVLAGRIATLESAIKSLSSDTKSAVQASAQRSDLDALTARIATLEGAVKSLSSEVTQRTSSSHADDRVTRLTIAAEALRATVERGAPYQAELGAVTALGGDQRATEALAPFAAQGLPSAAALGRELAAIVPSLYLSTEAAPGGGNSFLARLESHAQKLVRVTPVGTSASPAGDDPASVIARIDAAAARGDIAAARAGIGQLPDAARALTESWVKKVQAREAAIAASQRIAADALAALGKPVSQ